MNMGPKTILTNLSEKSWQEKVQQSLLLLRFSQQTFSSLEKAHDESLQSELQRKPQLQENVKGYASFLFFFFFFPL